MPPKKLLCTPKPYADESLAGYIIRLAENNYYNSPNWILSCAQLSSNQSEEERIFRLSRLIKVEKTKLKTMLARYLIESIHKYGIKICPECLKESAYCREIWDYQFVQICALHQCYMITECPSCHKTIKWSRPGVNRCNCSFDFRESKTTNARSIESSLSLYYYAQKGNTTCHKKLEKLYGVNHIIFDLDVDNFINLVQLFFERTYSLIFLNYDPLCDLFSSNEFINDLNYSQEAIVFTFLKNWQKNLKQFLKLYEKKVKLKTWDIPINHDLDIIDCSPVWKIVKFLMKICEYFAESLIFTEYLSVYLINLLEQYYFSEIEIIWDISNPKSTELFKSRSLTRIVRKIAKKSGQEQINLARLMQSSWSIDWEFFNNYIKKPVGRIILKEPLEFTTKQPYIF